MRRIVKEESIIIKREIILFFTTISIIFRNRLSGKAVILFSFFAFILIGIFIGVGKKVKMNNDVVTLNPENESLIVMLPVSIFHNIQMYPKF